MKLVGRGGGEKSGSGRWAALAGAAVLAAVILAAFAVAPSSGHAQRAGRTYEGDLTPQRRGEPVGASIRIVVSDDGTAIDTIEFDGLVTYCFVFDRPLEPDGPTTIAPPYYQPTGDPFPSFDIGEALTVGPNDYRLRVTGFFVSEPAGSEPEIRGAVELLSIPVGSDPQCEVFYSYVAPLVSAPPAAAVAAPAATATAAPAALPSTGAASSDGSSGGWALAAVAAVAATALAGGLVGLRRRHR